MQPFCDIALIKQQFCKRILTQYIRVAFKFEDTDVTPLGDVAARYVADGLPGAVT